MTSFTGQPDEWQRLDWHLLQNGGVTLYFRPAVLNEDLDWLRNNHYELYQFQCESWLSNSALHEDFKTTLRLPDYYGHNFDALDDCLGDVDLGVPEDGGAAIVLHRFDVYSTSPAGGRSGRSGRTDAEIVLDCLATGSRRQLLYGRRLLILVQSDDPKMRFERLGCISSIWNPREWLNKKRGL
jgi:Barstar (barnase inhibitor)